MKFLLVMYIICKKNHVSRSHSVKSSFYAHRALLTDQVVKIGILSREQDFLIGFENHAKCTMIVYDFQDTCTGLVNLCY